MQLPLDLNTDNMTYEQAMVECARRRQADREEMDRCRAAGEEYPVRLISYSCGSQDYIPLCDVFYAIYKRSRGRAHVTRDRRDGRYRWAEGTLLEGSPDHPYWLAYLDTCPLVEDHEWTETDWWINEEDIMP